MYAMNIQNDVIGLVLRQNSRIVNQNKWPTLLHDRADVTYDISFYAYKSTSNDTKGFSWKDPSSWKCEILHVIFTTMHKNN
jgi:hypothetical protein